MKVKKLLIIIPAIIIILLITIILIIKNDPNTKNLVINNIDFTTIDDGTYFGECLNGMIAASVEVEVKDKKITDIKIVKHDNGLGRKAEAIVEDVVNKQSLNVDTVSGATLSSSTILKAIENALKSK